MSFFSRASSLSASVCFATRLSKSFILESHSLEAKSCCLMLHIVYNSEKAFPSTIFFFPRAFAALTPGGRSVPFHLQQHRFQTRERLLNGNRRLTFSFQTVCFTPLLVIAKLFPCMFKCGFFFYGCWRRFRGHVSAHHSHFDQKFSLCLQLHKLHRTCTLSRWSCATFAYRLMPLFCHTQLSWDWPNSKLQSFSRNQQSVAHFLPHDLCSCLTTSWRGEHHH